MHSRFFNSVQMENYDYANSSKPSCGMLHGVECKTSQRLQNMLYIRTGNATTRDRIFTDLGTFYIASEGVPFSPMVPSSLLGELWVSYKVKLSRANLYGALLGNNVASDYFVAALSASTPMPVNVKGSNTIGGVLSNTGFNIIYTFPTGLVQGVFRISMFLKFPSVAAINGTYPTGFTTLNCTGIAEFPSTNGPLGVEGEVLPNSNTFVVGVAAPVGSDSPTNLYYRVEAYVTFSLSGSTGTIQPSVELTLLGATWILTSGAPLIIECAVTQVSATQWGLLN